VSLLRRITNLFFRSRLDQEAAAELQSHIEMRIGDNIAAGMSPEEARRDALLRFGNPTVTKERVVSADAALVFESIWTDIRYSLRQLRRSPGFAATVVLTLALGIGANLAVFQLLYGTMLAQLPIQQPDQIYSLHALQSPFDGEWFFSYPAYQRLRAASDSTPVIARSGLDEGTLQDADGSLSRAHFQLVSGNFFTVLGVSPATGRLFTNSDEQSAENGWPVVLRYQYAREYFGSENAALGRRFTLNRVPVVVVGVAPERFSGVLRGFAPDLWLPLEAHSSGQLDTWFDSLGPGGGADIKKPWLNQPGVFWLWLLARVPDAYKSSAPAKWTAALQPDIHLIATATKAIHAREQTLNAHVQLISAASGEGAFFKRYTSPLLILMAMAAVIFLVGCLNLANLQLARLWSRHREIAIRISLGAGKWRVMRQILIEDLLLALTGGALSLVTGRLASAILLHWASGRNWVIALDLHLNTYAVLLGAALFLSSIILFSVLPAWWMTQSNFAAVSGSKQIQASATNRWFNSLLAAQVSFSLLSVGMAYMFSQTLLSMDHIDTGMDREHVLSVRLDMTNAGFAKGHSNLPTLYSAMIERLKALPGVSEAAVQMCSIPGCGWNTAIHALGQPDIDAAQIHGDEDHIGTGYFRTMGIPLLRGRDFSETDRTDTQPVAILNRAYAKKLFGDHDPIGQWIAYAPALGNRKFLVVGEVADTLANGLHAPAPAMVYIFVNQNSDVIHTIEVRVSGSPGPVTKRIRLALHDLAPGLPVTEIVTLNTELEDGLTTEKLLARLTAVFGALTLALAALGFYGLLSFRVTRRTSEIGIRMVLGATRTQIHILILRQTFAILLAGILPGLFLTMAMERIAHRVLYGASETNMMALLFAGIAMVIAGVAATLIPAQRAASVDAVQAIKME
jgi:predicted permease